MSDITENKQSKGYVFASPKGSHAQAWIVPAVLRALEQAGGPVSIPRVFDVGCGNGSVAQTLTQAGYDVTGVDPSETAMDYARAAYPNLKLSPGSAYDDLAAQYGSFPAVISLEVVEHVYAPRDWARTMWNLTEPGGTVIISTPYHGYWKNLAIAMAGKFDRHFTALLDHGHIKFWSPVTLTQLLSEAGFEVVRIERLGRIPPLAFSMLAVCRRLCV